MTEPNKSVEIPTELPVVPLRQFVVFPYMAIPLFLARDRTIQAVDDALAGDRCVLLTAQIDPELERHTRRSTGAEGLQRDAGERQADERACTVGQRGRMARARQ